VKTEKKRKRSEAAKAAAETVAETVRESRPQPEAVAAATNGNGHGNGHGDGEGQIASNGYGGAEPQASVPPEPGSEHRRSRSEWLERAGRHARELAGRRGFGATASGIAAVLLAVWLGTDSALSLPLMVLGIVLVLVGVFGRRLRGHVKVEWGPAGASFDVRAEVAPPGRTRVPEAPSQAQADHAAVR
jgi:hypothetical protein